MNINSQKVAITCIVAALLQSACVHTSASDSERDISLAGLMSIEDIRNGEIIVGGDALHIREAALREAATTVGIQGGIKFRYTQINAEITKMASSLDFIYDFKPLLIREKMMPPIVVEANGTFGLQEDGSATSSLTAFEIIQDARLVASQPQWRDYLIHDYQAITDINPALRPKTDKETIAWKEGIKKGWDEGVIIADRMAIEQEARLSRDYKGSIRFHQLEQQGVLSMPTLSIGDMAVHVNGKKMDINQRLFRITDKSSYQEDSREWKAVPTKKTNDFKD